MPTDVTYAAFDILFAIIFFFIVIASIASKANKERKAQEWRRKLGETRPEDLPEATRRQLYGPSAQEMPEATRRQIYGPAAPRRAQPRGVPQPAGQRSPESEGHNLEGEGRNDEDWGTFVPPSPPQAPRSAPMTSSPVEMETRRLQEELRRQAAETVRLRQELDRIRAEAKRRQEGAQRQAQSAKRQAVPQPQQAPGKQRAGAPQSRPEVGVPMTTIEEALRRQMPGLKRQPTWLIRDAEDLRKSIIMMEILGPPKSLSD